MLSLCGCICMYINVQSIWGLKVSLQTTINMYVYIYVYMYYICITYVLYMYYICIHII